MTLQIPAGSAAGTTGGAANFAADTFYEATQLAVHDGKLYRAVVEFTSGAEFAATDWTLLASGPTAVAAPQISGVLGLPVVAEVTELYVFGTQDHTAYDVPAGMAAALSASYEYPHRLLVDVGEIRFLYINPAAFNITVKCGAASSSNAATATAGYFDGKRAVVIEPGGYAISDPLAMDLAAGTTLYERINITVAAAETWKINYRSGDTTRVQASVDKSAAGTFSGTGTRGYKSTAVLGPSAGSTLVAAFGDSITWGSGDANRAPGKDFGYISRALGEANIPLLNLGKPSETAQQIASDPAIRSARWTYIGAAGKATLMYGINDVDGGRTAAAIKADLLTIATLLDRRNTLVYICTVTPHSTSSDAYATVVNQTASASNGVRVTVNQWLRADAPVDPVTKAAVAIGTGGALLAGQTGHPITDVFDTCAAIESSQDAGKWKAPITGTVTTVNGSPNLTALTGAWVNGMLITGTGIPAGAAIGNISGSTAALFFPASGAAYNATASGSGVAITSGVYTADGLHPAPTGHAALATGLDTTKLL